MRATDEVYRIAVGPIPAVDHTMHQVLGDLASARFGASQICLFGHPLAVRPFNTLLSGMFPATATRVEMIDRPGTETPVVASAGSISDLLFKQPAFLLSRSGRELRRHIASGDVALAVNGHDHDQFVHAARLLLQRGNGNISTHVLHRPRGPAGAPPVA